MQEIKDLKTLWENDITKNKQKTSKASINNSKKNGDQ